MRAILALAAGTILLIALAMVHRAARPAAPEAKQETAKHSTAAFKRKPRLPAPRLPVTTPAAEADVESLLTTNLFTRLLHGDAPHLTAEQVESYLLKHRRSVESLLGAFEATDDRAFLREALEKDPNNPRVNFAAFFRAKDYTYTKPASSERRQWLEAFAKSAPDNALANYLLAFDDYKSGHLEEAVQQILAAAQKPKFHDYSLDFIQNAEETYRAAGWSEAGAKAVATYELELPHLVELREMGLKTIELASLYRQSGDEASAQVSLQLGLGLGQRLTGAEQRFLIHELVGCDIERKVLETMGPATSIGGVGQTAQNQLDAVTERRRAINETFPKRDALLATLAEVDLVSFFDRVKLLGDEAAVQWLLTTHGPQPSP